MSELTTVTVGRAAEAGSELELWRAVRAERDRNWDFYLPREVEFSERYPRQWLLIHSGGADVVASADLVKLFELRDQIADEVVRRGALIETQRHGRPWRL